MENKIENIIYTFIYKMARIIRKKLEKKKLYNKLIYEIENVSSDLHFILFHEVKRQHRLLYGLPYSFHTNYTLKYLLKYKPEFRVLYENCMLSTKEFLKKITIYNCTIPTQLSIFYTNS